MTEEPMNVEQWAAAEVAAMKPAKAPKSISEEEISAKVRVGLTREQAIEVITRQRDHDADLAAASGAEIPTPTKKEPAKKG